MSGLARRGGAAATPVLAAATAVVVTVEFIAIGLLPALARDLGVTLDRAGWLVSAFAVAAALAGPAATLVAGAWPARPVLAAGLAAFGLATVATALTPGFAAMLALRVVQGAILTPFVSVASAAAAALAGPGRAGRAIAEVNFGAVIAIALAVPAGVALAGLVGEAAVLTGLGALALAGAGLVCLTVPDGASAPPAPLADQAGILLRPRLLAHLALSALLFAAMFAAYSYIAAYLETAAGLAPGQAALALFGFGLAGIAGNWLAARHVDHDPDRLTLAVTVVLVVAVALITAAPTSPVLSLGLLAAWGAAHTAAFVACQVRVMFAAPDAPAFAASLNISVCNAGIAAGALVGGWVVAHQGVAMVGLATLAIGMAALAVGLGLVLARPRGPCRAGR